MPANTAPSTPTSLVQYQSNGSTVLNVGDWYNATTMVFKATVSDPDSSDTDSICVEIIAIGSSFTNTENGCGSLVTQGGTASVTISSGLTNGTQYHWQARTKDAGGLYSSWTSYGANSDTITAARDVGIDTSAPTTGTVYDGSSAGSETIYGTSSLSSLSCNWSGFSDGASSLASYDYSFGTTAGAIDVLGWTNVASGTTNVTAGSLTLRTGQRYFCNVRANDNAGNTSSAINSSAQLIMPSLTFTVSTNAINFATLGPANSYTDTKTLTLTTSTNAYSGYNIFASETGLPTKGSSTIADYASPASAPTTWSGTGFGYNIAGGSAAAAFSGSKYAHFGALGSPDTPVTHSGPITGSPISNEAETVTFKVVAPSTQAAGYYQTSIRWSCVASF